MSSTLHYTLVKNGRRQYVLLLIELQYTEITKDRGGRIIPNPRIRVYKLATERQCTRDISRTEIRTDLDVCWEKLHGSGCNEAVHFFVFLVLVLQGTPDRKKGLIDK